jgi:hypothetical protein
MDLLVLALQLGKNFAGTIVRSVVDAKHFEFEWNRQHAFYNIAQCGALVVNRYDD